MDRSRKNNYGRSGGARCRGAGGCGNHHNQGGSGRGNCQNQPSQGGGRGWGAPHRGSQHQPCAQQQWVNRPPAQQAWGYRPPQTPPSQQGGGPASGRGGAWTGRPWAPTPSPTVQPMMPPRPSAADSIRRPDQGGTISINLHVHHFPVKFDPEKTIFMDIIFKIFKFITNGFTSWFGIFEELTSCIISNSASPANSTYASTSASPANSTASSDPSLYSLHPDLENIKFFV